MYHTYRYGSHLPSILPDEDDRALLLLRLREREVAAGQVVYRAFVAQPVAHAHSYHAVLYVDYRKTN